MANFDTFLQGAVSTASNWEGYLLKINGVEFPNEYIQVDTYKTTPDQRTEIGSYVDANGKLKRPNVLRHTRTKTEFETVPLSLKEKIAIQNFFKSGMTNELKREVTCTYWNDEKNEYCTGSFYMPDTEFNIKRLDKSSLIPTYAPIRICIIEN